MNCIPLDFAEKVVLQLDYSNLEEAAQLERPWTRAASNDSARRAYLRLHVDVQNDKFFAYVQSFSSHEMCWSYDKADLRYVTIGYYSAGDCIYLRSDEKDLFEISRSTCAKLAKLPTRDVEVTGNRPDYSTLEMSSSNLPIVSFDSSLRQCRFNFTTIVLRNVRGFAAEIESLLEKQTALRAVNIVKTDISPRSIDLITAKLLFHQEHQVRIIDGTPLSTEQANRLISMFVDWQTNFEDCMNSMELKITVDGRMGDVTELHERFECMHHLKTHKSVAHHLWATKEGFNLGILINIFPGQMTTNLRVTFFDQEYSQYVWGGW